MIKFIGRPLNHLTQCYELQGCAPIPAERAQEVLELIDSRAGILAVLAEVERIKNEAVK